MQAENKSGPAAKKGRAERAKSLLLKKTFSPCSYIHYPKTQRALPFLAAPFVRDCGYIKCAVSARIARCAG